MKKLSTILFLIFILMILLKVYSVKASFEKDRINDIDYVLLQEILTKRTEIINEGIYNCDNTDRIIEELKTIEEGIILESDIFAIEEAFFNPTDYPKVNSVRVINIDDIKSKGNIYELVSTIEWNISYNIEDETKKYKYIIQIERKGNKYFLVDFRLQE